MRCLGPQSTLVLLNFRCVAPYPLAANGSAIFTNIDALPFEAVERIEILKGGASALSGSDAIAGVINIITKRDWVGLQGRISHERSLRSGEMGNSTASLTARLGSPGAEGGHLLANLLNRAARRAVFDGCEAAARQPGRQRVQAGLPVGFPCCKGLSRLTAAARFWQPEVVVAVQGWIASA